MKFSVAAVVAFAATVFAQPEFTNTVFNVVEGQPFTLNWRNSKGRITIELMSGPDKGSLNPVRTLDTLPDGTASYTFTPSGLPSGNYAFRISDESGDPPNYTVLIPYTGTGTLSSTTGATRTTRTSAGISSTSTETETETETETTTNTATKTTTTGTASSTGSASITTTLSTTTTSTSTSTSASRSASTSGPPNTNNGQRFASSLALVLGTVAALVFFN